jgi:copper chaperone
LRAVNFIETYQVDGMTCGHCVNAVSTEIGALPGVEDVRVDLATGAVTVRSERPVPFDAIVRAVDEAGYQVAGQG